MVAFLIVNAPNRQTLARNTPQGGGPQSPGREITKCILVVTPPAFWACDWSILPMQTLLQERDGGRLGIFGPKFTFCSIKSLLLAASGSKLVS